MGNKTHLIARRCVGHLPRWNHRSTPGVNANTQSKTALITTEDLTVTHIAYISHEQELNVVDVDGGDPQRVSVSGLMCFWPNWSPDGERIVYSGLSSGNNGYGRLAVYVSSTEPETSEPVLVNEPDTDAIARNTPHYTLWSPDGRRIAITGQTRSGGLTLFIARPFDSVEAQRVLEGGPLYTSWSADSRFLLAHAQKSHYLVDTRTAGEPRRIPGNASLYMAPSWSPAGNKWLTFRDLGVDRQALLMIDVTNLSVDTLAEIFGIAACSWSPDGRTIGLLRDPAQQSGYYQGLWLLDAAGSGERQVTDDPILSFFWSPDGSKIAYITPSDGAQGSIRWGVLDVESNQTRYAVDFTPTQEQITTFMFFDQYSQSHSPWSPDGKHLIFSGELGVQQVRIPLPQGPPASVFVCEADEGTSARRVAQGVFGTWSRG